MAYGRFITSRSLVTSYTDVTVSGKNRRQRIQRVRGRQIGLDVARGKLVIFAILAKFMT
jgi:hypothetical protein